MNSEEYQVGKPFNPISVKESSPPEYETKIITRTFKKGELQDDEIENDDSELTKMTRKFLNDISKHKDIILMQKIIHFLSMVPEYIETGLSYSASKIHEKINLVLSKITSALNIIFDTFKTVVSIIKNLPEIMTKIKDKINKICNKFYQNTVEFFNKTLMTFIQNKINNIQEKKESVNTFVQKIIDFIIVEMKRIITDYEYKSLCKDNFLCISQLERMKNDILYSYGQPDNFKSDMELIVKTIKNGPPNDIHNLKIYLNNLNQSFHFLNVDLMLEDVIRGNKPIATKKTNFVVQGQPLARIKQDVFANTGDITNHSEYGQNFLDPEERYYHSTTRIYGPRQSLLENSLDIESLMRNIIQTKNTADDTDTERVFLKRNMKFRNGTVEDQSV